MTEPEKPAAATEPVKTRTMFVRNTDPKGPMVIPIQVPIVEKTKPGKRILFVNWKYLGENCHILHNDIFFKIYIKKF